MLQVATSLSLGTLWALMCIAHAMAFLRAPRPQYVFFVLLEFVFVVLFIVRRPARTQTRRVREWAAAVAGTAAPLLMRPTPHQPWNPATDAIQAAGMALAFAAALALNRSFGIVPANRGVQSRGAYRFVRHPIYAGYIVSFTAYVAGNHSPWNAGVLVVAIILFLLRIGLEERHLSADAAYRGYCAATRWRLLPFIF